MGAFSTAATGTLTLQTAGKVTAARSAVLALGKATFKAKAGKAVAIVTARTATGGTTTKRYKLTIRAKRVR